MTSAFNMLPLLHFKNIKNNIERISSIKPFIDQYNWKEIRFPSQKEDWKKFELNNKSIVLNILFVSYNTEEIRCACKSKYNSNRENQVILLKIQMVKNDTIFFKKIVFIT